jgi:signal transduction histidine kinase
VLDLSKIEAGRMELELSRIDIAELFETTLNLVRERAARHGLTLTLDIEPGVDAWVADARKLKQVLLNLLSNAIKFTPAGGRVSVTLRCPPGQPLAITVADSGIGIAPQDRERIFEEFHQASGSYLRKSEGTGLGLSLARRFVELHGGRLDLHSEPGRGSTFTFTLPARTLEPA